MNSHALGNCSKWIFEETIYGLCYSSVLMDGITVVTRGKDKINITHALPKARCLDNFCFPSICHPYVQFTEFVKNGTSYEVITKHVI